MFLALRLDERLDFLDRRLSEQEALLERLWELLGMPQRSHVLTPSPPATLTIWGRAAIMVECIVGVFARLIVTGIITVLALIVAAAVLRLISK